jgi:hypothetical protein
MSESSAHNLDYESGPAGVEPLPRLLLDIGRMGWMVGLISFVLLGIFALFDAQHATRSLFFAWHFWLSVSLGCLGFVMISHLTGGGWGAMMRRIGEAGFMNLPFLLLVFLIMALGYKYLFPWAHPKDFVGESVKVLEHREPLYNPFAFTVRTLIYFFIWFFLAFYLRSGSLQLDRGEDLILRRKMRKVSAFGMVMFFVTTTGYALDYILSRETMWFSSIIGFITAVSMGLCGMSFIAVMMCYFADKKPFKGMLNPQHLNDYGNILLSLTILWMYTSFAQWLIQWNGNIPVDIGYYTHRGIGWPRNWWAAIALTLLLGQFFIPFFLLLQKPLKRNHKAFSKLAFWILCMGVVHTLWIVAPSGMDRDYAASLKAPLSSWWHGKGDPDHIYITDLFSFAAVGGIWIANYMRVLGAHRLIARNAPDLPELVSSHGTPSHAI